MIPTIEGRQIQANAEPNKPTQTEEVSLKVATDPQRKPTRLLMICVRRSIPSFSTSIVAIPIFETKVH